MGHAEMQETKMRTRILILFGIALAGLAGLAESNCLADEVGVAVAVSETPTPEAIDFFETRIRPVLIAKCYACHSEAARSNGKLKGGLLLDSRQVTQTGGDSGPAVVPHKIDESLLIESIRYGEDSYQMPPEGKLSDKVIADFEKWVTMGAPDPRDAVATPGAVKSEINW